CPSIRGRPALAEGQGLVAERTVTRVRERAVADVLVSRLRPVVARSPSRSHARFRTGVLPRLGKATRGLTRKAVPDGAPGRSCHRSALDHCVGFRVVRRSAAASAMVSRKGSEGSMLTM